MKNTVSCNKAPSERLFSRCDLWKLMLPLVLELLLTLLVGMNWLFRVVVFGFRWLGGKWKLKKVI